MRADGIRIVITVALTALITWGIVSISSYENAVWPLIIGCVLCLGTPLMFLIGFRYNTRTMVSARICGTLYLGLAFIMNLVFAFFDFSLPVYAIANGIPWLIYILIFTSLLRTSKEVG